MRLFIPASLFVFVASVCFISSASASYVKSKNCVTKEGELITAGYYPVLSDCTKYFHCWNGLVYISQCQEGESFDREFKECRPSDDVDCSSGALETSKRGRAKASKRGRAKASKRMGGW